MEKATKVSDEKFSAYHPLLEMLLKNRGITTPEEAERFLHPDYERDIADPFRILNMERAVERILSAIDHGERIAVYGDYDCDGIPGSVVLHDFFDKIGYRNIEHYIPHRHREGYGLNPDAIEELARRGTALIITVDCGIADVDEVAHANKLGMEVIITDHHLPQEKLPRAYAILNSKQEGDTYPDRMLCGAGMAWKLVSALLARRRDVWNIPPGWEKWLLDMAGLATIADMVPLRDENRAIAHFGLKVLRKSPRPGLLKLLRSAGVEQRRLTEDDVGFMIAPRINAASRMGVPSDAFRLLSTRDEREAGMLAEELHRLNDTRKGLVASMIKEAKRKVETRGVREVIVVGNPSWMPGVLGLAANRLMEEYGRPAFVWGRGDAPHIKGSCRSDGTINVVELMVSVRAGILLDAGGHELSGGFSVSHEHIHFLEEALLDAYQKIPKKNVSAAASYAVDAELSLAQVTREHFALVDLLAPFGAGNPKPTFLFRNITIGNVRRFGKEKNHLELRVEDENGVSISAISFFSSPEDFPVTLEPGVRADLIGTMEHSAFRGKEEIRLRIVDIAAPAAIL